MKRVIELSWFKKMINRMFTTENEEEQDYEYIQNDIEESAEADMQKKERPVFRFPIITDAEIYGWDEDPEDTKNRMNEPVQKNEIEDDDFVPIPLYKNERWPKKEQEVHIHRATSSVKYPKRVDSDLPMPSKTKEKGKNEEIEEKKSTIITKRSSRPFTPSSVPSPIYGYNRPEHKTRKSIPIDGFTAETKDEKLHSMKNEEQNRNSISEEQFVGMEDNRIDLENSVHTSIDEANDMSMQNSDQFEVGEADRQAASDVEEITIEKPLTNRERTEAELTSEHAEPTVHPEERTKAENEIATANQEDYAVEEVIGNTVIYESNTEQSNVENKEDHYEDDLKLSGEIPSDEDLCETAPAAEERAEINETKKERIIPFNVLMLKKDKENMTSQRTRQSTIDKEKTVQQDVQFVAEQNEPKLSQNDRISFEEETVEEVEPPYYALPSTDYLLQPEEHVEDTEWLSSQSEKLTEALSHFSIEANVIEAVQGPTVTRFELTVGQGTKVSKIRNLTDDLKLALAAEDIRIQAPIPKTSSIGIEIPNRKARAVRISEVIETEQFQQSTSPMEAVLGLDLTGDPVTIDLRKMPHGMIAGATGSGKSVCINSILISLLYKADPTDVKMLLIDPKMVELAPYNGIPHLLSPVITDVKAATAALKWAVEEMERRYELFAHIGARNIERYNEMVMKERKFSLKMPYLLLVIDELADLMMMAPADVEVSISRITQKARACGIHLIIATQRPSVDVITGLIKANVPTRIAFSVSSQIDSRTILDVAGAERLLGKGDMLYLGNGQSTAVRLQGTFVTDEEIERIIEHVQNEAEPDYLFGQEDLLAAAVEEEEADPLFEEVCQFIIDQGSVSTSLLQRNFGIGYNRAAKLMDRLENLSFISEQRGSKPRDVYLSDSMFEQYKHNRQ